ncbi:SoxY-related AACIE arm protein [Aquincola sp. S2]|uniref:SoxY-related AACIE arm protein n=1 Tax=Pseudaquabacterium terrae TaxID=2732868 RepID=A0ABX2EL57_9BURK|nr:SoxY-related AACIE arm protein [Aquabacterium terrae]NRF69328.1 SoxY-related AACIE arm protein [Aquabacterium terrae]
MSTLSRRTVLQSTGALWAFTLLPAHAQVPTLDAAIRAWAGAAQPREGRVVLEIAPLVENGNAVPITVRVDSPMTAADHVQEIAVFNEHNPQRDVARFRLSPASGRAVVSTRIRLATSQQLATLARFSDGSIGLQRVDVLVTLAACIEG